MTARRTWRLLPSSLLAVLALSAIYPVVFVAFAAFKTTNDYGEGTLGPPLHPTLHFINVAWTDGEVATTAANSAIVVAAAIALIVVVSTLAGWALAAMRFRLRWLILLAIVGMMLLPPAVLMIPIFSVVRDLGLVNNRLGLVLVYASLHAPFATYLMTSYMRGIPAELVEAATVDGAGVVRVFRSIVLPLSKPAILTIVTLTFLWLWNELLFGLIILQDESKRTLMVGLASLQGQFSTDPPLIAAGMLIAMAPALAVFFLFQRNLAAGLTAGAVK